MVVKRYDENKLKELEKKGVPIDWAALDALFGLGVSAVVTADVDISLLREFKERIKNLIRESGYSCELLDILVFIMILGPEVSAREESTKFRRKDCGYVIRKKIDFLEWKNAEVVKRIEMIFDAIVESISRIPQKHLSDQSKANLVELVSKVAKAMISEHG